LLIRKAASPQARSRPISPGYQRTLEIKVSTPKKIKGLNKSIHRAPPLVFEKFDDTYPHAAFNE
jgi:hypothetical protein